MPVSASLALGKFELRNRGMTRVPMSTSLALGKFELRNREPTRPSVLPDTARVGLDAAFSDFLGFLYFCNS